MQGRMQQTAYVGGIPFLTASGNISQYGWTGGMLTSPALRLGSRWSTTNARGDGFTDNLYAQIPQENFNGAQERSVEGGSPLGGEDGENKETREGYVEGDTPHEDNHDSYTFGIYAE